MTPQRNKWAIVAILSTLALMGACALLMNQGKYGMVPADTETPVP